MPNIYTCIAYLIEIRKFCSKNLVHKGDNFEAQNAPRGKGGEPPIHIPGYATGCLLEYAAELDGLPVGVGSFRLRWHYRHTHSVRESLEAGHRTLQQVSIFTLNCRRYHRKYIYIYRYE